MVSETRYTSDTVRPVPKQSKPSMVLKAFRLPEPLWERLVAWSEARDLNPSDALREAVERLVREDDEQ